MLNILENGMLFSMPFFLLLNKVFIHLAIKIRQEMGVIECLLDYISDNEFIVLMAFKEKH